MMNTLRFIFTCCLIGFGGYVHAAQLLTVDHHSQTDLGLTVYNSFALVRDSREVVLPRGELMLDFEEVAQTLVPSSVAIETDPLSEIDVLEQSYRYDLLNRESLLETYIGRKLKYSRTVLRGDSYEKVLREGKLLSTNPEIVDFGDEIEISPEGVISLPDVPDGLTLSPTLVWRLNNNRTGEQRITTRYIANQISWRADYVLSLDETNRTLDLTSWATVRNDSGTVFENTSIRLIAGTVNRASRPSPMMKERVLMAADARASVSSESLQSSETNAYQAYDLPLRTTLLNHESKQLKFVQASNVSYEQTYRLRSQFATYQNGGIEKPAVISEISFANDAANQLGVALAEGLVRAYLKSAETPDLLGEARLPSTPRGQRVELALGQAFDVTAERKQTEFVRLSDRSFDVSYEVAISNARDKSVVVEVDETMQGDWQVQESSQTLTRVSSQLARATVQVPPGSTKKLTYRIRVKF